MSKNFRTESLIDAPAQYDSVFLPFFDQSGASVGWTANEPRRFDFQSPLSTFLGSLLMEHQLTIRDACKIAGCSPSVLHGWLHGAYPTDTVIHLKLLCNHFGYTLSEALTGSPDKVLPRN